MKRSVLIAFMLMLSASMAFAQAGSVGVFADAGATNCNFADAGGLVQVQIVHVNVPCATASQFKLEAPAGWVHLGDTWNFQTVIGSSIAGVSVAYGADLAGLVVLGSVNFFGASLPACTLFGIVADPTALSGEIEAVDCDTFKVFPTGGSGIVNPDVDCNCTTPVQETTWGGVKALYN